jgi:hypothetical protein
MNRIINIEFVEEAAVEIPAITVCPKTVKAKSRRHFWRGWQLFGAE